MNKTSATADLSATLALACELIRRPSVTPEDAGCQQIMAKRLESLGFKICHLPFGDVDNLWAVRGDAGPLMVFAGHSDVVPTGPENEWSTPPFEPSIDEEGILFGRGAADMKGSLAAMITACERFISAQPDFAGRIGFLITSDEEGPAINGTVKVVEWLQQQGETIDWCIVGEPTSREKVGDVIKNGRRGSLGCELRVNGVQGHVAYPQLAKNPIHSAMPAIAELSTTVWDEGNTFFPATSFQVSNINSGTGATNVIPGYLDMVFNFRFSTELTVEQIKQRCIEILAKYNFDYEINWNLSGLPFLTESGKLMDAVLQGIHSVTGLQSTLSTDGGTSDGRFIAPTGTQLVELGPCNESIHKVNECVRAEDLNLLSEIYEHTLKCLFDGS